jgi:hypothetical protein
MSVMTRVSFTFSLLIAVALCATPLRAQDVPSPLPSASASLLPEGNYPYKVTVRGVGDADGHVVVQRAPNVSAMSETTLQYSSTYLVPGSATPQFVFSRTYYASRVALDDSALPAAFSTEIRPDRGWRFYGLGKLNADGTMQLVGNRRGTFTLPAPSTRWVTLNGLGFAGAFLLPYEFQAAQGAALTLASTETGISPYACTQGRVDRPKDVPVADVALHCTGGREDVTVWYDPATLVPDKIEIPVERATLMRRP